MKMHTAAIGYHTAPAQPNGLTGAAPCPEQEFDEGCIVPVVSAWSAVVDEGRNDAMALWAGL